MRFLLDTNVILRHFSQSGQIGKKAKEILRQSENGEHELVISVISLMEIMYLADKNRISIDLNTTIELIENSETYSICNLITEIIKVAQNISFYELHDRLLLATAKHLSIPIISSDSKFRTVPDIDTIWD